MFCDSTLNNKINRIHERALWITYKDMRSYFDTMLLRDNSVPFYVGNLQLLLMEVFKTKQNLNPSLLKEIFVENWCLMGKEAATLVLARSTYYVL